MITICGIAGISLSPTDKDLNVAEVAASLLAGIASRGPDATGAAWYDKAVDSVQLTKIAVPVPKFLAARKSILPKKTAVIILHTRYATTGDKSNRANNHPIHYGSVIGVHNGVLWDHRGMFKDMKKEPQAQVDSEAIMALLDGSARPEKVLNRISGDAALGWIDLNDPEVLHLARVVDRPLFIAQTAGGSLLFASTQQAVENAAKEAHLSLTYKHDVEEGKYLKVAGGVIKEYLDIPGVRRNRAFSQKYAYTSGYQSTGFTRKPDAGKTVAVHKGKDADDGKVVDFAERTAKNAKNSPAENQWVRLLMSKRNDELLAMVRNNGSWFAEQELAARGIDKDGSVYALLTDEELVQMVKDHSHPWARIQLSLRNLDSKGVPYKQSTNYVRPTDEDLVVRVGKGDNFAVDCLFARGLGPDGKPLLEDIPADPATPLFQAQGPVE